MSVSDPVADMLTRIRNAHLRRKARTVMPASGLKLAIAEVMADEGYIQSASIEGEGAARRLIIVLKYYQGKSVIESLVRISKSSRRVYKSADKMPLVMNGLGIAIVSTSKGVMSAHAAREAGVGGEILCYVS